MAPAMEVRVHLDADERQASLLADVRAGLAATPKSIPPTWFYDEVGSELFEDITRVEEYYPTRAERAALDAHATEIVERSKATTLVELGSGSSEKTRVLLDAMAAAGRLEHFVPFDVSETILTNAARDISRDYDVPVTAVVGDFRQHLGDLPRLGNRLIIFLGGTIGNLDPSQRHEFLTDLASTMDYGDWLLLGTDLEKDERRLVAAYDDAAGVTARFNLNVLSVLNNELGADFDPTAFRHVARWNAHERRIEMWLRSTTAQRVRVGALDLVVEFDSGEEMLTEISSKFTPGRVADELANAGFALGGAWTDPAGDFLVSLAHLEG